MKSEVFTWRVSPEIKARLEVEARRRNATVSAVLDSAVSELLNRNIPHTNEDAEQLRLHAAAEACFGLFESGEPDRAENSARLIREWLRRRAG